MGQAIVDPPESPQNPKPATAASADDLLAQLAGDEIDRLLAESEGQTPAKDVAAPADAVATAAAAPAPISADSGPVAESVGFDSAHSAAEIDALLAGAEAEAEAKPAPEPEPKLETVAVPTHVDTELVKPSKPAVVSAAAEVLKEIEQNDAERAALRGTQMKADSSPMLIFQGTKPLPLIFRPLEWLSAPLDACPDVVREAIGKIAIVTLVNAFAVMAYVLIFRRHH